MKKIYEVVLLENGEENIVDILRIESQEELEDRKSHLAKGYSIRGCSLSSDELIDFLLMIKEIEEDVEYIGRVGVDSGQLLISDPCYVNEKLEPFESLNNHKQVLNGLALAFSFAKGDGIYGVYAKKDEKGRIYKIEIE
ncbi:hypothetical protein [Bacillus sp. 'calajunan']|uniref:hypothetical protein n=1 Tax=Bacillus sp. 'calajunan' TaxID=3447457 RepID=UPI003EE16368